MDKSLDLLGVTNESKQNEIKSILTNLIQNRLEVDPQSYDSNMTKLVESLGGNKLKPETQKDLINEFYSYKSQIEKNRVIREEIKIVNSDLQESKSKSSVLSKKVLSLNGKVASLKSQREQMVLQ